MHGPRVANPVADTQHDGIRRRDLLVAQMVGTCILV